MSHIFSTQTAAVRVDLMLPFSASKEAILEAAKLAVDEALDEDCFRCVFGETRSGWAVYTVRAVLENAQFPTLRFLTDRGHGYRFEDDHECICMELIDADRVGSVLADFERFLVWLRENRNTLLDADAGGCLTDSEVEASLERDYVSLTPAFDPRVKGEDGQSADYLFTYLRSVCAVLQSAAYENRAVLHVLRI